MLYSILIHAIPGAFDRLPKEKQDQVFKNHNDLQVVLKERGSFVTAKLMPTSHAVTLKPTDDVGEKPLVIDGPFAETKERFMGFYVADFESLDEAIELASMIASPYASIELRPVAWAGGDLVV
jgi:hypothetical protein